MNNSQDKQLDQLLVDWANTNAASPADLASLDRQISERLSVEKNRWPIKPSSLQHTPNPSRRLVLAALAIAASLLVAVGIWGLGVDPKGNDVKQVAQSVQKSSLPSDIVSLEHQIELLKEYRAVFGSQLVWVVEEEDTVDVGLHGEYPVIASPVTEAASPSDAQYVAVQLTLWSRPIRGQQDWSQVETYNVLAEREQLVELTPQQSAASPLLLWAYPLDNSLVSIDLEYRSGTLADVSIDSSNLQLIGEQHTTNIQSFEKDGVEYRLYQTAELVDAGDLG